MKLNFTFFLLFVALVLQAQDRVIGARSDDSGPYRITGKVLDFETREAVIGANLIIPESSIGESANLHGDFTLKLKRGIYTIVVSSIGYIEQEVEVEIRGPGSFNVRLQPDINTLDEIVVTGTDPDANVRATTSGVEKLSIESISSLPPFAGEVDVLKSLTLLPGVNSAGEASAGFNVRGGGYDQNLILLGGAPIYNPSHLFGFFSAFNSEMINNVVLYKGGIPANYGGRASSILDLSYKKGDYSNWTGNLGLGNISTKISGGGPIIKDKLSIYGAGRVSYANYLINLVRDPAIKNSSAQFYDGSVILNYKISDKSNIDVSSYYSADGFNFASDTTFSWNNFANVVGLNHAFNDRLFLKVSGFSSQYRFNINDVSQFSNFKLASGIKDRGVNIDAKYILNDSHTFLFGVQSKYLDINPGTLTPQNEESSINSFNVESEQALESGIYLQHEMNIGEWLGFSYGARFVDYRYLGPKKTYTYIEGVPKDEVNIVDETDFMANTVIANYSDIEPRLSLRLSLSESTSFKLGYNRLNQFIHLLSNTSTIAPTDIWKLSDGYIKPQTATQYSLGIFQNFSNNSFEASIEGYYKSLNNLLDYKDGAKLLLNRFIESEVLSGNGEAYGIEFYLKKKAGNLTGWFSYTYSRSLRQVIGSYPSETINQGNIYPSNFDKPHDVTGVLEYRFSPFIKFSSIFNYSTGRPVTYPSAKFFSQGAEVAYYDSRNQNRILDYHRLDLSLTFNIKTDNRLLGGDWVFSIYNAYGRKNAFSVYFDDSPNAPPTAYRLSVIGIALPSLSYNIKI